MQNEKTLLTEPTPYDQDRLDSWKEIATYLGREVRTCQRWEKHEGLPVHRHLHEKLGTVYAYRSELDTWLESRRRAAEPIVEEPTPIVQIQPVEHKPRQSFIRLTAAATILVVIGIAGYAIARRTGWINPVADHRVRLAVLPFENLSSQTDQDYFSDGMTEEMITQLARIEPERLGLIGRTSIMHYKGTSKNIATIGQELGVDYILEGSVRREADRVRVTTQLIRVKDQTHLWAENYDRASREAISVQTEVANRIAESLVPRLLPTVNTTAMRTATTNPAAYDAYLKGRYALNRGMQSDLDKSIEFFESAVKSDPNFADAYSGLAEAYTQIAFNEIRPGSECFPKAQEAINKALAINDRQAEAHSVSAMIKFLGEWNWDAAETEFNRSINLNPNVADAHHDYAQFLSIIGRHDQALKESKIAQELEPLSATINSDAGWFYYRARRYDEAMAESRNVLKLEPTFAGAQFCIINCLRMKGQYEEARAESIKLLRDNGKLALAPEINAPDPQEALKKLDLRRLQRLREMEKDTYITPFSKAYLYASAGDVDNAMNWLETAYQEHDIGVLQVNITPIFDVLRPDPRFCDLVKRIGLPS
jgi:TolB-like protein/Flp pilus assembly protein TadD